MLTLVPWSHGPWKPELFMFNPPEPCNPNKVTISLSLISGNPFNKPSRTVVGWLLSVEGTVQLAIPSGKFPSRLSLSNPYGFDTLP